MSGWQRIVTPLVAAVALGYLVTMVVSGAQPVQRQLVRFEAKGVLKTPPERVRRIELSRGAERITLVRRGEKTWVTLEGAEVNAEAGKRISMAVQMMHTSSPVREIPPEELADVDAAAFELDPPRIMAKLYEGDADPVLTVRFGGRNPDEFLQYMRIDGDLHLYLVSRFVGEEWMEALNGSLHR
jgi:hypothetical protein